jgi:dUTP pyrophosphatase
LLPGPYLVRFNETVNLPPDVMAYARPRSSLLRSAVALHTAVWDAGYSGQGVALLVVYNLDGFVLQRDARIVQLVFHRLERSTSAGYEGAFQGERAT